MRGYCLLVWDWKAHEKGTLGAGKSNSRQSRHTVSFPALGPSSTKKGTFAPSRPSYLKRISRSSLMSELWMFAQSKYALSHAIYSVLCLYGCIPICTIIVCGFWPVKYACNQSMCLHAPPFPPPAGHAIIKCMFDRVWIYIHMYFYTD